MVKKNPDLDAMFSDICIGTSAAPVYLPAHKFQTKDSEGNILREFNLIDGAVIANNSVLVEISEVTKEIMSGSPDLFPIKPIEYGRFLVLSLGTGTSKSQEHDATECSKWGVLGWLIAGGSHPLIDIFTQASGHIDDTLRGDLQNLVKVGEKLLKKQVSRVNLGTCIYEPYHHTTNEMALNKFAAILHEEKNVPKMRSPHTNKGGDNQAVSMENQTARLPRMSILSHHALPNLQSLNTN
ncbi:putative Acyl transferase/acyl hydrolase/lysophospholipase [Helianthus annuus]|nr:putative Acyl transferase/acyl hydrolase/lysophospholipase [Helianthus annuus]